MIAIVVAARQAGSRLAVPAGVVGQVWRDGRRLARLARLLGSDAVEAEPLTDARAPAAGQLCGMARHARRDRRLGRAVRPPTWSRVVTSDPVDLAVLDASLRIVTI